MQATVRRAEELRATVALPLVDGDALQVAHLVDPQGNRFAVWRPKPSD